MSTTYESVLVPAPTPTPRGALWFGRLLTRLLGEREPEPAIDPREREAAAVREMALSLQSTDPHFAADLLAAADRHARGG